MPVLVVTLPTKPPRSFVAWRNGAALIDPAWLRIAEARGTPLEGASIDEAHATLRYLYGPNVEIERAA